MKNLITIGLIGFLFSGCQATHLAYIHATTMGLEVAGSTQGNGRFVLGYDRDTYALIPRIVNDNNAQSKLSDAMSLAAVSCIHAKGLDDVQFRHFVSTGIAAVNVVQDSITLAQIKESIQGGGTECTPQD